MSMIGRICLMTLMREIGDGIVYGQRSKEEDEGFGTTIYPTVEVEIGSTTELNMVANTVREITKPEMCEEKVGIIGVEDGTVVDGYFAFYAILNKISPTGIEGFIEFIVMSVAAHDNGQTYKIMLDYDEQILLRTIIDGMLIEKTGHSADWHIEESRKEMFCKLKNMGTK